MTKLRLVSMLLIATLGMSAAAPAWQGEPQLVIPLTELGAEAFEVLQGPFDELRLAFQIPPDWQLQEGSELSLGLQTFFSSFIPAQGEITQEDLIAGFISISIDGKLVERQVLSRNGETELVVALPLGLFAAHTPDHELVISWDAGASCDLNLSTTILIDPGSVLLLSYTSTNFTGDLSQLPYPFFGANALEQPGTLIVLPNASSEAQVAAGLVTAAGLGRSSSEPISILTEDQLNPSQRGSHHLIFVGPVSGFSTLANLDLPHQNSGRLSQPDFGFVELIPSPWNAGLGLLVISGESDQALLNSALNASSGTLLLNSDKNFAIVEGAPSIAVAVDVRTANFAQLGQGDTTFQQYGRSAISIPFYVSPGRLISSQSNLDLRFAHSKLMDYLRSGLSLTLNGAPLTSVRLSDQTSGRHSEQVLLSPTAIRSGWNQIGISADILPLDLCANQDEGQQWLTIYADSNLNLPVGENTNGVAGSFELDQPSSFGDLAAIFADQMQQTTMVFSSGQVNAWSVAAELLRGLAAEQLTWPMIPNVSFVENFSAEAYPEQNFIFLGQVDDFLASPAIYGAFSLDQISEQRGRINLSSGAELPYEPGVPMGMLEINKLNEAQMALAVWANSPGSLGDAVGLLLNPNLSEQYGHTSLLVLQNDTLIADQGASDTVAEPTLTGETTDLPGVFSTGKGAYLYILLVLLLLGLILILWGQIQRFVKNRFGK